MPSAVLPEPSTDAGNLYALTPHSCGLKALWASPAETLFLRVTLCEYTANQRSLTRSQGLTRGSTMDPHMSPSQAEAWTGSSRAGRGEGKDSEWELATMSARWHHVGSSHQFIRTSTGGSLASVFFRFPEDSNIQAKVGSHDPESTRALFGASRCLLNPAVLSKGLSGGGGHGNTPVLVK